jgi:hypothetical protein
MSTAVTPTPEAVEKPRPSKIPSLNPYIAPNVFCSNRDCGKKMDPVMITDRGGERSLRYDCEPCNYSFYASMVHAQGQCRPLGKDKSNLPEVRR